MLLAVLFVLAVIGHTIFWLGLVNRLHGFGFPRKATKIASVAMLAWIPLGCFVWIEPIRDAVANSWNYVDFRRHDPNVALLTFTLAVVGACGLLVWGRRRIFGDPDRYPHPIERTILHVDRYIETPLAISDLARALGRIPRNQMGSLAVENHDLPLIEFPSVWNGLTIAHLSDLHFTGHVAREYFDYVVDRVNEAEPDLICLTGDIVDTAACLDWIPRTLGRLRAKHGKFYILGNHDSRCGDLPRLHRTLAASDFQDVGGAWRILKIGTRSLLLAGCECPWFGPAADFQYLPRMLGNTRLFRMLLSHSPDRFQGAIAHDFDLMLAGHTHGGQFVPPIIGPVLSPSVHGVKYCGGTFRRGTTTMHVSRGISAELPWRWNALPELSFLKLTRDRHAPPETPDDQADILPDPACTLAEVI